MDLCWEEAGRGRLGTCSGGFGGFWLVFLGVLAAAWVSGVGFMGVLTVFWCRCCLLSGLFDECRLKTELI